MKRRDRGSRRAAPSQAGTRFDIVVRPPPGAEHGGDDDCALCRMTAGQTPIEVITLPDGSVLEVHEMPPIGPRGGSS